MPCAAQTVAIDPFRTNAVSGCCNAQRRLAGYSITSSLIDEPWLLPPPDTDSRKNLEQAFKARGLEGGRRASKRQRQAW